MPLHSKGVHGGPQQADSSSFEDSKHFKDSKVFKDIKGSTIVHETPKAHHSKGTMVELSQPAVRQLLSGKTTNQREEARLLMNIERSAQV